MKREDLKYLMGLLVPAITFVSLYFNGIWSFACPIEAFIVIPILEQILPKSNRNLKETQEAKKAMNKFFDVLLYLNVPLQFGLLFYFLSIVSFNNLGLVDLIGKTLSMGISCGVLGINVAHELGHRSKPGERVLAKLLLLSSLYMHFIIEHNRGHHKNVSTPKDPASAKLNEPIYIFWIRSIVGSYFSAWSLEKLRLKRLNKNPLSINNEMIRFGLIQLMFIALVLVLFNLKGILFFILAAVIGILLLETVNYIEHYGLRRKEIEPGLFEKVKPYHSWNSDHILGRLMLYELTRHSDHHYKATRKYQILRSFDQSPQLPYGYPASMMLSLLPPLWFALMNGKAKELTYPSTP